MDRSGVGLVRAAEQRANRFRVPRSWSLRLGDFVKQTLAETAAEHLSAYAGHLAFRALFAIFPSLISLLWLLTVFYASGLVNPLLDVAKTSMPAAASDAIRQQLLQVPRSHAGGAFTLGAVTSLGVAIWALSATFRATMEAMNAVYTVKETRPTWRRYLISLLLSFALAGLLLAAILLVLFGSGIVRTITSAVGLGILFQLGLGLIRWVGLIVLVLAAFALVYYFAPDVRQRFRWINSGSLIAVVLWLFYTVLFSFYIDHFVSYNETYGALAGIAVLMVYLYGVCFILLLGAEMNQVIELNHPEGKNQGERVPEGEKPTR